eukprot:869087_1
MDEHRNDIEGLRSLHDKMEELRKIIQDTNEKMNVLLKRSHADDKPNELYTNIYSDTPQSLNVLVKASNKYCIILLLSYIQFVFAFRSIETNRTSISPNANDTISLIKDMRIHIVRVNLIQSAAMATFILVNVMHTLIACMIHKVHVILPNVHRSLPLRTL